MNRGRFVARVAQKLGLDDSAGSEELILMQEWFNEGVVDVLLRTHCYVDIGDLTLSEGTTDYRLDSNILALEGDRVTSDSLTHTFKLVTMEEIIERNALSPVSGDISFVAFEGNLMMISPPPDNDDATMRFWYVPRPTAATADGTTGDDSIDPSVSIYGGIPTEYHLAIEYYMLWQGAEYDDKQHALGPADYFQGYVNLCDTYRKDHRRKAGRSLARARVGYPRTLLTGRRNDVYPGC